MKTGSSGRRMLRNDFNQHARADIDVEEGYCPLQSTLHPQRPKLKGDSL